MSEPSPFLPDTGVTSPARNIRDVVAYVAHGVLINVLHEATATKLLYAAQVAHSSRQPKNKTQKDTSGAVFPGS